MKYKVGFVLGRFQPFHRGHQYLIEKALEQCESVIVGVGSVNVEDEKIKNNRLLLVKKVNEIYVENIANLAFIVEHDR